MTGIDNYIKDLVVDAYTHVDIVFDGPPSPTAREEALENALRQIDEQAERGQSHSANFAFSQLAAIRQFCTTALSRPAKE